MDSRDEELSMMEKLRELLAEGLKIKPEVIEVIYPPYPPPTLKWELAIRATYLLYYSDIFVEEREGGKVKLSTGPERTRWEIAEFYLHPEKYRRKEKMAKTEEERWMIAQKEVKEAKMIIEDFRQRKFEKYLGAKGNISYYARKYMWGDEVAKRISNKYNIEVRFEIDTESGFFTDFDSTGMNEEQKINEILKRAEAMLEAGEMFRSKEMMDEYLASIGLVFKEPKRRRRKMI